METAAKISGFAKFAWFTLAYNILVILWGVFLRASKSGDGCGQHWLTCQGEMIPSAPELKTIIEFSHRMTTGPAFVLVVIVVILAFRQFEKGSLVRKAALASLVFIVTEVLIGGVLVLTGNTAETLTAERPFLAIGHLINSFLLLASLTLTTWYAGDRGTISFAGPRKPIILIAVAAVGILLVGTSGSVAALSNMLFPASTLAEGIARDFSASSNILLKLRISHPILSIATSVYLVFLAGWLNSLSGRKRTVNRSSNILTVIVIAQVAFGALTLLTLAPILMQVGHLLLAALLWISFILLSANFLSRPEQS
ncbi:MAG: COX15/CtaA family protein [Acidobacteriota bacterium]